MNKHNLFAITVLAATCCTYVFGRIQEEAIKHYQQAEYQKAIPLLQTIIQKDSETLKKESKKDKKEEIQKKIDLNQVRLAQSIAALAIDSGYNQKEIEELMEQFDVKHLAIAHDGLGDTIQAAGKLKLINEERRRKGLPDIGLHLPGFLWLLKEVLERAGVSSHITCDKHDGKPDVSCNTTTTKLFNLVAVKTSETQFMPYLVPKEEFKPCKKNSFAICWRSGTAPVYGGRRLHRDLKVKDLIDAILKEIPDAHFYSVQGPPHRIITESEYKKMTPEQQEKHALDVVPDSYAKYFTNITDEKPFEDTINVLNTCIQIGCDTVNQHIAANLPNGKTIMIIPAAGKDGTSNRDWRWGTERETSAWYPKEKMRIFEIDTSNPKNFAKAIAILKEWLKK